MSGSLVLLDLLVIRSSEIFNFCDFLSVFPSDVYHKVLDHVPLVKGFNHLFYAYASYWIYWPRKKRYFISNVSMPFSGGGIQCPQVQHCSNGRLHWCWETDFGNQTCFDHICVHKLLFIFR